MIIISANYNPARCLRTEHWWRTD